MRADRVRAVENYTLISSLHLEVITWPASNRYACITRAMYGRHGTRGDDKCVGNAFVMK